MGTVEKALTSLGALVAARPQQQEPPPKAKIVQLPLWPEAVRGTPNAFLRSALFAAIQGKERRYMERETLGSYDGLTLRFTGQQLDQSHLDVWEQIVHLARLHPLGELCHFKAHAFLKAIGRKSGKSDYDALDCDIEHLRACAVVIKHGGREYVGGLVQNAWRDKETGEYKVILDPQITRLFYSTEWTGIEWEARLKLKGKPLALWLHGFYSTHAKPYPIKVETLHKLCGSTTKEVWKFKQNLKAALDALCSITGWTHSIDGDLVTVTTTPTPAQQKHLTRRRKPRKRAD
ncbi:MAG TPA: plasmid replication initiator TrfA [Armatimonadota bacterium]|nr:plasmid replication initiator TrfA [Armatimonadota bacterium]